MEYIKNCFSKNDVGHKMNKYMCNGLCHKYVKKAPSQNGSVNCPNQLEIKKKN